jgi:hypothetical protein
MIARPGAQGLADKLEQFHANTPIWAKADRDILWQAVVALRNTTPAAVAPDVQRDAERYRWLRDRDLETINTEGGVFAGKVPDNVVMNGDDLDQAIDEAMK